MSLINSLCARVLIHNRVVRTRSTNIILTAIIHVVFIKCQTPCWALYISNLTLIIKLGVIIAISQTQNPRLKNFLKKDLNPEQWIKDHHWATFPARASSPGLQVLSKGLKLKGAWSTLTYLFPIMGCIVGYDCLKTLGHTSKCDRVPMGRP